MGEDGMSQTQNNGSPDTSSLYAWLSRDKNGVEGIIVAAIPSGIFPLVTADYSRAQKLEPVAKVAADARGHAAELARFDRAETLAVVPAGDN